MHLSHNQAVERGGEKSWRPSLLRYVRLDPRYDNDYYYRPLTMGI